MNFVLPFLVLAIFEKESDFSFQPPMAIKVLRFGFFFLRLVNRLKDFLPPPLPKSFHGSSDFTVNSFLSRPANP